MSMVFALFVQKSIVGARTKNEKGRVRWNDISCSDYPRLA